MPGGRGQQIFRWQSRLLIDSGEMESTELIRKIPRIGQYLSRCATVKNIVRAALGRFKATVFEASSFFIVLSVSLHVESRQVKCRYKFRLFLKRVDLEEDTRRLEERIRKILCLLRLENMIL